MRSSSIAEPAATRRRLGVVGPGLMGLGIAWAAAAAGVRVVLCGRDGESARAGRLRMAAAIDRQIARERLERAAGAAVLDLVQAADSDEALGACEIVIESVDEDRAIKTEVLRRIEGVVSPETLIASNTSGLAIGGLADALTHRGRFLGLHFFSPAERMALVEVVEGPETDPEGLRSALAFVEAIGKRPVRVRDGPGFFATRVFAAYLDEALAMVGEGVDPQLVEAAGLANGRALGPLAMLDETGLALNLQQARQARADGLPTRFCRPLAEPVLARVAALGRGGRRDGGGFFDWPAAAPRRLWPGLTEVFARARNQPDVEIVALRLLCAEALQALRCLEEGVIASADDSDAASVLGLGFPARKGGVLRWAEDFGLPRFVAACDGFARDHGDRFEPSQWLRGLAERGEPLPRARKNSRRSDT